MFKCFETPGALIVDFTRPCHQSKLVDVNCGTDAEHYTKCPKVRHITLLRSIEIPSIENNLKQV